MIKFRLKEDWYLEDFFDKVKIYDAGHIFLPSEDGNYIIENPINKGKMIMSLEKMSSVTDDRNSLLFEKIEEKEINLLIEENKDSDDEIKKWRIQLDVNTTKTNLKKIEKFIKENIGKLL